MTDRAISLKKFSLTTMLLTVFLALSVTGQAPVDPAPRGNGKVEPANPAPLGSEQNPARVSGGVMAGSILRKGTPIYPKISREQHVSGATVLALLIDPEGRVKEVTAISGPEAIHGAAIEAVRQWTYKPFLLNGRPVFVRTTVTLNIDFGA